MTESINRRKRHQSQKCNRTRRGRVYIRFEMGKARDARDARVSLAAQLNWSRAPDCQRKGPKQRNAKQCNTTAGTARALLMAMRVAGPREYAWLPLFLRGCTEGRHYVARRHPLGDRGMAARVRRKHRTTAQQPPPSCDAHDCPRPCPALRTLLIKWRGQGMDGTGCPLAAVATVAAGQGVARRGE